MNTQRKPVGSWKWTVLLLLLPAVLLAAAGCRQKENASSQMGSSKASETSKVLETSETSEMLSSTEASLSGEGKLPAGGEGLEAAKSAALAHAGLTAGQVTYLKELLEVEGRDDIYELEFVTETTCYEYEIRASDNAVLECSQEPVLQLEIEQEGLISAEEAKTAALAAAKVSAGEAAFTKIELERDDGVPEYTVEFVAGTVEYECTLDAFTGEVLEQETTKFL